MNDIEWLIRTRPRFPDSTPISLLKEWLSNDIKDIKLKNIDQIITHCLSELKSGTKVFILPECFWDLHYKRPNGPTFYRKDTTL